MTKEVKKTREQVIEELIAECVSYITDLSEFGMIEDILRRGCKGYDDYTNEELVDEWNNNIGEGIEEKLIIVDSIK